jgi:hypothetical protein
MYTHFFQKDGAWETNVANAPVMIGTGGDTNPGVLGIGSGSTVLQSLYDAGIIGTKTYGLYLGTAYDRAGGSINGSNTFGGYDSGRFTEPVHTYPMDLQNPDYLPVTVADIIINNNQSSGGSGGGISAMVDDQHQTFTARITTDRHPLLLPYHITQNLMSQLGAVPDPTSPDNALAPTRSLDRTSLTLVLADGFNITLPGPVVASAIQNTPLNYTGPFYLSAAFLSQVYVVLDFDARQFHLARAIQSAPYIIPRSLCPSAVPVPYDYTRGGRGSSSFSRAGLAGAVVGGVVGGIALLVLAWCVVSSVRRKQMAAREQESRWAEEAAVEEKAVALGRADVEMQAMKEGGSLSSPSSSLSSSLSSSTFVAASASPAAVVYEPIRAQGQARSMSLVSQSSRLSSMSSGSRPASLRGHGG